MNNNHMLIHTLGLSLGIEIHYITSCYIKGKSSKKEMMFLIISQSSMIFYTDSFDKVKQKINFKQIDHGQLTPECLMIILSKQTDVIKIIAPDLMSLSQAFNCYYSVYHYQILGTLCDITNTLSSKDITSSLPINQTPYQYKIYKHFSGYQFFISDQALTETIDTNTTYIFNDSIKLDIMIEESKVINQANNINDLLEEQFNTIDRYMQNNYHMYKLLQYYPYNKKNNIDNDYAVWDCIRIDYVSQNHDEDNNAIRRKEYNCSFIIMRRKFIPPLYDKFQDIIISISEPSYYQFHDFKLSNEANKKLETLADSVHYHSKTYFNQSEYSTLLQRQFDGLLLNEISFGFFSEVLSIKGTNSYVFGLKYCYKLLSNCIGIKGYNILKDNLRQDIIDYDKCSSSFDVFNKLDDCPLESIIKDFSLSFLMTHSMSSSYIKYKTRWENKIWIFLGHCVNRIMIPMFDYETLIKCYFEAKIKEDKVILYKELINLLYMKVYDKEMKVIDFSMSMKKTECLDNVIILKIEYNETLLLVAIKTLFITEVIRNNNDLSSVLIYLIDNHCYKDLLQAIVIMVKQSIHIKDHDHYKNLIPSLLHVYSIGNINTSIIEANEACRCLIHMSSLENSNNENSFPISLIQSPLFWQSLYLSIHYEELLFNSLRLINTLLHYYPLNDKLFKDLLQSNKAIIIKLLSLIKGTGMNKVHLQLSTIKSIIIIMINILIIHPSLIQEILVEEEDIYQHLLYYLHNSEEKIGKWPNVDIIQLQETIIKMFSHLFTPNTPQLNKLSTSLDKIINTICQEDLYFLIDYSDNDNDDEDDMKSYENQLRLSKLEMLMKFSLKMMSQDELLLIKLSKDKNAPFIPVLNMIKKIKEKMLENMYYDMNNPHNTLQTTLDATKNDSIIYNESIIHDKSKLDISNADYYKNDDQRIQHMMNMKTNGLFNKNHSNMSSMLTNTIKGNRSQRKFKLNKSNNNNES